MTLQIKIDADEVTEALDRLDKRASADAVKKALRAGAKYLRPKVKAAAPKGPSGNERRKVGYRVRRSKTAHSDYYAVVNSFSRHHHLVVDGSAPRFTKAGAARGRMPANPYIGRVADANQDAALAIAEAELARQLDLE